MISLLRCLPAICLLLLLAGCDDSKPRRATVSGNTTPHNEASGEVEPKVPLTPIERGQKLFRRRQCLFCHMITGNGTRLGPNLSGIASRMNEAKMRKWIRNPKALKPGTQMPLWEGSDDELEDVISYLQTLK